MSEEMLRRLCLQVRNWGKWGPDDGLGTLNYITPACITVAARLVTRGKIFAVPRQTPGGRPSGEAGQYWLGGL